MTDSKIYSIARKVFSETSGRNFHEFFSELVPIFQKNDFFFSKFDDQDFFKFVIFTYQFHIHQDENLSLDFLLKKTKESNMIVGFYTDFTPVTTTCDECYGDGSESCYNCDGSGEEECPQCEGRGVDEEGEVCEDCNGNGEIECSVCYGDGSLSCDTCDGDGEVEDLESTGISLYLYLSSDPLLNTTISDNIKKNRIMQVDQGTDSEEMLQSSEIYSFNDSIDATEKFRFVEDEHYLIDLITDLNTKGFFLKQIAFSRSRNSLETYMKTSLNSVL